MAKFIPLPHVIGLGAATLHGGHAVRFTPADEDLVTAYRWTVPSESRQPVRRHTTADERRAGAPKAAFLGRAVGERIAGRPLTKQDVVRHRDGDRLNFVRENLEVLDRGAWLKVHECPVTPGRLADLYHAPTSVNDLRDVLAALDPDGRRPAQATVTKWLQEAGVTLRTEKEAQRVWRAVKPEAVKRSVEAMHAGRNAPGANTGNPDALRDRKTRRRLVETLRPRWQATHYTRECPRCGKTFERLGCYVRRQEKTGQPAYCSKSCSAKAAHERRRVARVVEAARAAGRVEAETPEYLALALESARRGAQDAAGERA